MKRIKVLLAISLGFAVSSGYAQVIPFSSERWTIVAEEHSFETYKGEECLVMKGGIAYLEGEKFINCILEFDMAIPNARGFFGAVWRLQDMGNYEEFYARSHQSGNPDASQYTPVFNGVAGWQLYYGPGYGAAVKYRFNEWMHVKIIVSGDRGEIYIMDMEKPAIIIDDMKMGEIAGKVGLKVNNFSPGRLANFKITSLEKQELTAQADKEKEDAPGLVTAWEVSDPFSEDMLSGVTELSGGFAKNYKTLLCEESGTANLASVSKISEGNTVLTKLVIYSDSEQLKQMDFGYSDRIKVYVNGKIIYSGSNDYRSRDYRYLGTIGFFDAIYLPLKKGENTLIMGVSESFGGWGLKARFTDLEGIRLK
jgi:hypothetical protein